MVILYTIVIGVIGMDISINNHSYRGFIMLYPNISRLLGVHHSYINLAQPGEQLE